MKFLCFDGETKDNKYNLLGNNFNYIFNKDGLTSKQCFDFIFNECNKFKGFKFVILRIGFDVNFWIKDLGEEKIKQFINTNEIEFEGYKLQYFTGKFLIIRKDKRKIYIYDIYNFFQKSLLKLIELLKIELTDREKYIIELGKKDREQNFNLMSYFEVIEYNKTECVVSSKICNKIFDLMKSSYFKNKKNKYKDFVVNHFYGSSAISSKILNEYDFKRYSVIMGFQLPKIQSAFNSAYFGGRMEGLKLGTFKNVFKYDINSAYPYIINQLKEFKGAKEKTYEINSEIVETNLYFINFKIIAPNSLIGLLPIRHKSGMLFFPNEGKGWYFGCELIEFKKYAENNFIDYSIKKEIVVELGESIFNNAIEEIYEQRRSLKAIDDLRHYIYKIALNAVYGKLAQQIGTSKYFNSFYAGYITSKTRSMLLQTSFNNWDDIIFYATDGILSKKKLPVKVGTGLGDWEEIKIKSAVVLLSGVYNLIGSDGSVYSGERGYKFDFDNVLYDIQRDGFATVKQNLFIGWKYGLKNYKKFGNDILKFIEMEKIINPKESNIKRLFLFPKNYNFNTEISGELVGLKNLKGQFKLNFEDENIYE